MVDGALKANNTCKPGYEVHPGEECHGENCYVDGDSEQSTKTGPSRFLQDGCSDPQQQISSLIDPLRSSSTVPKEPILSAAPKKMLFIRSDGKLSSPEARSNIKKLNNRKGSESKTESPPKQKLVVLKYGLDSESRTITARKIQKICSGHAQELNPRKEICLHTPDIDQPLIPTHPFFRRIGARSSNQTPIDKKSNGAEEGDVILDSPSISRSPKKIDLPTKPLTNVSAWASVSRSTENSHIANGLKSSRFPGAIEAVWPPSGMIHVRSSPDPMVGPIEPRKQDQIPRECGKMKYTKVEISEHEEILHSYTTLVQEQRQHVEKLDYQFGKFRRPLRSVMTGPELQSAVHQIIESVPLEPFTCEQPSHPENRMYGPQKSIGLTHSAVLRILREVSSSSTAFDRFECETQDWAHKYAPNRAQDVLQPGCEVVVLRDWLSSLTITTVENTNHEASKKRDTSSASKKLEVTSKRKKRRRTEELGDFIITDDEEDDLMDELKTLDIFETSEPKETSSKKSLFRVRDVSRNLINGQKATNAVVISGPHGCGKTAAIYAVAQELDFEVFEINAGSRRSGRDILEKVGDMAQNHLVNHSREEKLGNIEESTQSTEFLKFKPEVGLQGIMKSFLQPKAENKKRTRGRPRKQETKDLNEIEPRRPQNQKQSVILLEEVDVLFEEDKQFWTTTLELILQSKRPIIITCTDESLIPLEELFLFAILRFKPPTEQLAVDYLLLIASNEGHLLARQAVTALFRSKNYDLRASIMTLNFFCQMGIGDTKGGLEWMLTGSSPSDCKEKEGKKLRVVSENTYFKGMSCFDRVSNILDWETAVPGVVDSLYQNQESRTSNVMDFQESKVIFSPIETSQTSRQDSLKMLLALEQGLDSISSADTYSYSAFRDESSVGLKSSRIPSPLLSQVGRS